MTGFRVPTHAQVNEALRRIPTPELRRAFFEGLKNPHWLGPLASAGCFSNPPEPEKTGKGLVRDWYWPEIEYLVRVAPDAPSAVIDVLLKLGSSTNAWVKRGTFAIGVVVPAAEAARLKPLLKQWQPKGFGWRTDPRQVAGFIVNLLRGGYRAVGIWVADSFFKPSSQESSQTSSMLLDGYWIHTLLPEVTSALGAAGLKVVLRWLVAYERGQGAFTDTLDMTHFSRESIRSSIRPTTGQSVEQSLVNAVCQVAVDAMAVDPAATVSRLTGSGMLLARKIAMYALTDAIGVVDPDARKALVAVATDLLSQDQSRIDPCRIEFAELVRAIAPCSPGGLEEALTPILNGPGSDRGDLRERLRRDGDETDDDLDRRLQEYLESWRHRWLSGIGREALPGPLKQVLAVLDLHRGVIHDPLALSNRITSWSGPNSPVSVDEMAAMSPHELLAQLESWHPAVDRWGPEPSHEGQSRILTALITGNPNALADTDGLVQRLRPTYIRAILSGWKAAVNAGLVLPWDQVVEVIHDTSLHSDALTSPAEGGRFDDDPDYRLAKRSAVELLEALVKQRDARLAPDECLARFADLTLTEAADSTAWADYSSHAHESGADPHTLSINEAWPTRLRAIVNLITYGPATDWSQLARSSFERELARNDPHGASRTVLGEAIGRLLNTDPEWIKPLIPMLFGSGSGINNLQQIALTTAMAAYHYHRELYDLLSPSIIAAIQLHGPIATGWQTAGGPLELIGEWVVDATIFGHKDATDPVAAAFYSEVSPEIRGKAIGTVAWSFMHADTVDTAIRDRLGDLWDARVEHVTSHRDDRAELAEFHWFVTDEKFDPDWWLPRLQIALDLDPDIAKYRHTMSKQIARAAPKHPRAALDVTRRLSQGETDSALLTWDMMREAIPTVIAHAIRSGDDKLVSDGVAFMNLLGEDGFREVESLVTAVPCDAGNTTNVAD